MRVVSLLIFAALVCSWAAATVRPVVLMHGLMATSEAMNDIERWLRADFPGIYVKNVEIGNGQKLDSLFIEMNKQVANFSEQIAADPQLQGGFDLIGHSQGGLITRAYIERFGGAKVHNYFSLAGPQAGVYGVPDFNDWCPDVDCPWIAALMSRISEGGWMEPFFQSSITFAQYWKNPLNYSQYLAASSFLPDVNNERVVKNATYRANMVATTGQHWYIQALQDHIVVPKQTEWFEFFTTGQDATLDTFTQTPSYQGDWIGTKTLYEAGRLHLVGANCSHQNLPRSVCKSSVYDAFIRPNVGGQL